MIVVREKGPFVLFTWGALALSLIFCWKIFIDGDDLGFYATALAFWFPLGLYFVFVSNFRVIIASDIAIEERWTIELFKWRLIDRSVRTIPWEDLLRVSGRDRKYGLQSSKGILLFQGVHAQKRVRITVSEAWYQAEEAILFAIKHIPADKIQPEAAALIKKIKELHEEG